MNEHHTFSVKTDCDLSAAVLAFEYFSNLGYSISLRDVLA